MTETQQVKKKTPTGTAWIIWGSLLLALGAVNLVTAPMEMATGDSESVSRKMIGILVCAGLGAWLLIIGLNKRRAHLTR